jgi:hypothetical protein
VVWYVLLFRFESGAFLLERLQENVSDGITDYGQGNRLYRIMLGCLLSVLGYLPVLQCAWWNSKKQVARSDRGRLAAAVGGVTALCFSYVLLLRLVYGAANLSSMQFGYLQLISDSAFLKRVLVFAAGAWLTMLFLFLVSVAGTFSDEKESQNKNSRAAWKKRLALTGLVVFAGACCYKYEWSQTDWSVQTGVRSQTIWGGQYDSHEIENQLYPLAVGIDTQDGKWLITYCFLEEEEAGGGEEDTPLEEKIVTLQADTWEAAAQKLKEMRLGTLRDTHVQAVVLGSHLLEEPERLELLQKQWLSLRIRIGSAACFQAEDTKESLQSVAEEITTYSGWKKLVAAQRQENGGEKITVACVLSKWQSQEQSWSEEVEIPFLPD